MQVPGNLILISAPSGTGKTTLVSALLKRMPKLRKSVSHTTRAPRANEVDGEDYHFVSESEFNTKCQDQSFLEYAKVFENYYGTDKAWVLEQLAEGYDVILEIDWQGAASIRQQMPESCSIFILPPSRDSLIERLRARNMDHPTEIDKRFEMARLEVAKYVDYDYLLVNDEFTHTIDSLVSILTSVRLRVPRQELKYQSLLQQFARD